MNSEERPGSKARTHEDLAKDLMLALEIGPQRKPSKRRPRGNIGERPGQRGRAIFLVGAGCSQSAGVPLAAEIAQRAVQILAERYLRKSAVKRKGKGPKADLSALIKDGKLPARYRLPDDEGDWEALYSYLFSEHFKHPNHQREIISSMVGSGGDLNWAHACLGELVSQRYVHTVLTTNFDQLVLEGIIRTGILPVVADGLESLSRIDPSPSTPQVVHLHGSMHTYDLRNSRRAVTETRSDESLRSTMRELLRKSTVLVIVGYRGGEEGIMDLIQSAASSFARMVIYWVAYEKDYRSLSDRAKKLIQTGENIFFVIDQDADRFFQRVMRELKIGQPRWVEDPVRTLLEESGQLIAIPHDEEIGTLVQEYRDRIAYANKNREPRDNRLVEALDARTRGSFSEAIALLEGIADASHLRARRLLAQSWRDKFFSDEDDADVGDIEKAVEGFRSLIAEKGNLRRINDVYSFIDASWDLHDHCASSPLSEADVKRLHDILAVINRQSEQDPAPTQKQMALLLLYKARVSQELSEKAKEGHGDPELRRQVLRAYSSAWNALKDDFSEKSRDAEEGLAGAMVADAEFRLKDADELDDETIEEIRGKLNRAIQMHATRAEFAWYNSSWGDLGGSLSNFASAYLQLAQLERGRESVGRENALREARRILGEAITAYVEAGDEEKASSERARLIEIED